MVTAVKLQPHPINFLPRPENDRVRGASLSRSPRGNPWKLIRRQEGDADPRHATGDARETSSERFTRSLGLAILCGGIPVGEYQWRGNIERASSSVKFKFPESFKNRSIHIESNYLRLTWFVKPRYFFNFHESKNKTKLLFEIWSNN